jgi:hypothetical protein
MVEMRPVSEGAGVEGGGDGVEVAVPATGGTTSEGAGVVGGSDDAGVELHFETAALICKFQKLNVTR